MVTNQATRLPEHFGLLEDGASSKTTVNPVRIVRANCNATSWAIPLIALAPTTELTQILLCGLFADFQRPTSQDGS